MRPGLTATAHPAELLAEGQLRARTFERPLGGAVVLECRRVLLPGFVSMGQQTAAPSSRGRGNREAAAGGPPLEALRHRLAPVRSARSCRGLHQTGARPEHGPGTPAP